MTSVTANLGRLKVAFTKLAGDQPEEQWASQAARRIDSGAGMPDDWERRILKLCDGRPISRVAETLFNEEISAGGWAIDLGLYKGLFARRVFSAIAELVGKGSLHVKPEIANRED